MRAGRHALRLARQQQRPWAPPSTQRHSQPLLRQHPAALHHRCVAAALRCSSSAASSPLAMATAGAPTLAWDADTYGGVLVRASDLPPSVDAFKASLSASLAEWRGARKRGVWLKLPLDKAEYVPHAARPPARPARPARPAPPSARYRRVTAQPQPQVAAGFQYHHAEATYLMLTQWLPADEPSTLPANASHQARGGPRLPPRGSACACRRPRRVTPASARARGCADVLCSQHARAQYAPLLARPPPAGGRRRVCAERRGRQGAVRPGARRPRRPPGLLEAPHRPPR